MSPAYEAAIAACGGGAALLLRTLARYVRERMLRARVRREADDGPEFGTPGWIWKELLRERGARHALRDRIDSEVAELRERVARLEGRQESGEQVPVTTDRASAGMRSRTRSRPG